MLFAPLPRFPSHRSHCSGGTGVLVMLTLTNWFVSLFHTLLKVGQSLDILENPSSVPATFPTDNNPSCYSENAWKKKKCWATLLLFNVKEINRSAHLTCQQSGCSHVRPLKQNLWHGRNETCKHGRWKYVMVRIKKSRNCEKLRSHASVTQLSASSDL